VLVRPVPLDATALSLVDAKGSFEHDQLGFGPSGAGFEGRQAERERERENPSLLTLHCAERDLVALITITRCDACVMLEVA